MGLQMIPLPEGLAITVDGVDKESPWRFLKRIYYENPQHHNGKKAYETQDRQYTGAKSGAKLSLWFADGSWRITEGNPGQADARVYAVSSGHEAASPESATWTLEALPDESSDRGSETAG